MTSALPISLVVDVQISRDTVFRTGNDFGQFNFVGISDRISTNERIRQYNNLAGVAVDFPSDSEEYIAASQWFNTGISPIPTVLYISRWVNANTKAQLRSGAPLLVVDSETATCWKDVTDGSFRITINGVTANVTAIDFSAQTTLAGVASQIQAALVSAGFTGATCVFDTLSNKFWIQSGTAGDASTISYLTTATASVGTDISGVGGANDYLNARATANDAELVQGMDAETITDCLNTIDDINDDWYGFGFYNGVRDDDEAKEASEWAESKIKLFFTATNDAGTLSSSSTSDIAYILKSLNRNRSIVFYNADSAKYPDVAFASRGFVLDAGTENWKFKKFSNIVPSDINQNQYKAAIDKSCNLYVEIGGTAITTEGVVSSGEYIDIMRGTDWQQNLIGTNLYFALNNPIKVPYTDAGVAILRSSVSSSLDQGVLRGFFAPFLDADGVFHEAYEITTIPVASVPVNERAARKYNYISFVAYLSGAINNVKVTGSVTVNLG